MTRLGLIVLLLPTARFQTQYIRGCEVAGSGNEMGIDVSCDDTNFASGRYSTALGSGNTETGFYANAMGDGTTA